MQSTATKSSKRNSNMTLTPERREYVNAPGSFNKLFDIITENNINIDYQEVMNTIRMYIESLTETQQSIFKAHYWRQMSIYDIRVTFGYRDLSDVERPLKSATKKYIQMLKDDYGTKE